MQAFICSSSDCIDMFIHLTLYQDWNIESEKKLDGNYEYPLQLQDLLPYERMILLDWSSSKVAAIM